MVRARGRSSDQPLVQMARAQGAALRLEVKEQFVREPARTRTRSFDLASQVEHGHLLERKGRAADAVSSRRETRFPRHPDIPDGSTGLGRALAKSGDDRPTRRARTIGRAQLAKHGRAHGGASSRRGGRCRGCAGRGPCRTAALRRGALAPGSGGRPADLPRGTSAPRRRTIASAWCVGRLRWAWAIRSDNSQPSAPCSVAS